MTTTVTVECVACKHKQEAGPGKEAPMCEKCFSPTVAVGATA